MLFNSTIGYYLLGVLDAVVVLDEELVNEIKLINLTDWGWLILLSFVILVVWLMIVLQAGSKGAHEFGSVPDSDNNGHGGDQTIDREISEPIQTKTGD